MNKPLRILFIIIILISLAACGRRQAALEARQATSLAATLRASGQQPPAPTSTQHQPAPTQDPSAPGQDQPTPTHHQLPPTQDQPQPNPEDGQSTDLAITRIEPNNPSPKANQGFEVAVTIENFGPATAPSFRWVLIPDYRQGGANTPSLDMGGPQLTSQQKITIRADALYTAPGTYTMRAMVNAGGNPNDPNPNNDFLDIQITVGAAQGGGGSLAPDLTVTNIQLSNPTPQVNERVEVAVTVRNIGSAAATGFTWAIIPKYHSGGANKISAEMGLPEILPGKEITIRQDVTYTSAGTFTLRASANAKNIPADPNPANDTRDIQITVGGGGQSSGGSPRLFIASHNESPTTFKVGEEVKFSMIIKNEGSGAAQNFTWAVYPAYQEGNALQIIVSGVVDRLEAGASTQVTAKHTYTQAGTYTVGFNPDIHDVAGSANQGLYVNYTVQPASGGGGALVAPTQCTWQVKTETSVVVSWKWDGNASSIQGFRIYEGQLGKLKQVATNIRNALVANLPSAIPPSAYFYVVSYNGGTESARVPCSKQ